MKMYHICEYCESVFNTTDIEGTEDIEGAVELRGTCEGCLKEIGLDNQMTNINKQFWYN